VEAADGYSESPRLISTWSDEASYLPGEEDEKSPSRTSRLSFCS
jgi:hypothetical protein